MNAALGLGRGYALDAVDAAFEFKKLVGFFARHVKNDFFKSTHIGGAGAHDLDPPATRFRVTAIHAEEIASKDIGLVATSTTAYFHNGVTTVGGIRGDHETEHVVGEAVALVGERLDFLLGHLA